MAFSSGFPVRGSVGTRGSAGRNTPAPRARTYLVTNWSLALASLLGAAAVVIFAYEQLLSAGCNQMSCSPSPGDFWFTLITRGAPIGAVLAVGISFFTAKRRLGFLVPLAAWAFLVFCYAALVVAFP